MPNHSVLWQLTYPDGRQAYLFGTMHVRDELAFSHISKATSALIKSKYFFAEMDLEEAQQKIGVEQYLMPNGLTIQELVGSKKYAKWRQICHKAFNFDLQNFSRFYPIIVTNKIAETRLSTDYLLSLDHHLWAKAKELNLMTGGIEDVSFQINVLQSLDLQMQLNALKISLKNVNKFKRSVDKLSQFYTEENISALYKESRKSLGSFRNILLFDRNKLMSDFIVNNNYDCAFFAVGAAHLAGKKGLLKFLKDQKIKLKALN